MLFQGLEFFRILFFLILGLFQGLGYFWGYGGLELKGLGYFIVKGFMIFQMLGFIIQSLREIRGFQGLWYLKGQRIFRCLGIFVIGVQGLKAENILEV